jgi:outer membrane PBP1 activator LpoA protein
VALLLPLNSASYGRHADAVRQGFLVAAKMQAAGALPIRVYPLTEDSQQLLAAYTQAVALGAQMVVGPLTRDGVAALAASGIISVPTLGLNMLDVRASTPPRLYLFGLAIELEARQVAKLAYDEGRRSAYVLVDETPLSKRMRDAFVEDFEGRGGQILTEFAYGADQVTLNKLRLASTAGTADVIFLAIDSARARAIRPYVGNAMAIYATSQVNGGRDNPLAALDLNLVRFLDMPWLLQADHPAVMIYPRAQFGDALDFDRLYALGIDAFRVSIELLQSNRDAILDGVTGRIRLTREQQFLRELTAAQYVDGKIVVSESKP